MSDRLHMVFDVESIGLHGEGFAVAYVVVDGKGNRIDERVQACHPDTAIGNGEDHDWVREHVPEMDMPLGGWRRSPKKLRDHFWDAWSHWRGNDAVLWADCGWPVEARFLADCIADDPHLRKRRGPYPLHEIATVLEILGEDPIAKRERLDDEPRHNPLGDARQSARILVEALKELGL